MTELVDVMDRLERRMEQLRSQAAMHEATALQEHAEIHGMETVIEAVMPLLQQMVPPPIRAETKPRQAPRDVRGMVLELIRKRPNGITASEICDTIGRCEPRRIESTLAYWGSIGAVTGRDGLWRPHDPLREEAAE